MGKGAVGWRARNEASLSGLDSFTGVWIHTEDYKNKFTEKIHRVESDGVTHQNRNGIRKLRTLPMKGLEFPQMKDRLRIRHGDSTLLHA